MDMVKVWGYAPNPSEGLHHVVDMHDHKTFSGYCPTGTPSLPDNTR